MSQLSQQSAVNQRFAYLLQPIKDLALNWNIDISNELENYLQEIESITVTFDGGKTKLNFAEAALLIQGTVCVYTKKVEYLYALVYQVLDFIANKKKLKHSAKVGSEDNDTDGLVNQDEDDFLSLDDITESKRVIQKDDTDNQDVSTLRIINLSLAPLMDPEKGDDPLINKKGEIIGNRKEFKINVCCVHPNGSLLLDWSYLNVLELSIQNKPSSTPFVPHTAAHTDIPLDNNFECAADEGSVADLSLANDPEPCESPPGNDEQECETLVDDISVKKLRDRETCQRTEENKLLIQKPHKKQDSDPWINQDPHEKCPGDKIFCKRHTVRLPPSLKQEATRKRKRNLATLAKKQPLMSLSEFCNKAFYSRTSHSQRNPMKLPVHSEFDDLFWTEYKQRQARLKKEYNMLKHQNQLNDLSEQFHSREDDIGEIYDAACGGDDDDNNDEPVQIPFDVVQDLPASDIIAGDLDMLQNSSEREVQVMSSYEELLQQYIDKYIENAQTFAKLTDLTKRVAEWEEKILPVLEEEQTHGLFDIHHSGTEVIRYLETHVTQKENDRLVLPSEKTLFKNIVQHKPPYETCRLFLATLQLANSYNIEISVEGTAEVADDTMAIRLLSTTQQFEELKKHQL